MVTPRKIMSEQNKALESIVANAEAGVSVTYLTGNAGTGKTYTAQQLISLVKAGTVLAGWKVLDCAPQGKASDIAAGADSDGTTMQSLFKINNRVVLPKGVGFMKYHSNRDPVAEVVTQAKRAIERKLGVKTLKREKILLYIEEVMAASAEDLAAVRMIMSDIALTEGVKFHILAVGHPLQNIDDYTEEVKENEVVICTNYRTPAFDCPRWDNGEGELVTHHSFFKDGAKWSVKSIHLKENKRQGEDPLGAVLDKWTTGESIGADLLAILPKENIHTFAYGMKPEQVKGVNTFITPSLGQEKKINSTLINREGAFIFYPYLNIGEGLRGHVCEYSAKSCSVKFAEHGDDAQWIEIPNIYKAMFRACVRNLPVDIENVIVPGMPCLFRNNGVDYKNGTMGVVVSFLPVDKVVEVQKENGENILVEYIRSKELKGDAPFEFKYLPLMPVYGVTTGKVQGCTFNHPVGVCIDARNNSPKPHAAYVGMSRVTNINDLHLIISNVATDEGVDLTRAEMLDQALSINAAAMAFHNETTTGVVINDDCADCPDDSTVATDDDNELNNNNNEEETTMTGFNFDLNQLKNFSNKTAVTVTADHETYIAVNNTPERQKEIEAVISTADVADEAGIGATEIGTAKKVSLTTATTAKTKTTMVPTKEFHMEPINPVKAANADLANLNSVSDELIDALEEAEAKLETAEAEVAQANRTIEAQAKEIEQLKAQLANAQTAANQAALEAKAAKAEAEAAKANAVPREELLAMRGLLDRILGGDVTVAETTTKVEIPAEVKATEPEVETAVETSTEPEVEIATKPEAMHTFRIEGDKTNIKLRDKVDKLLQAGFVIVDNGAVDVVLTTEGVSKPKEQIFNVNMPAGRQYFAHYLTTVGTVVK